MGCLWPLESDFSKLIACKLQVDKQFRKALGLGPAKTSPSPNFKLQRLQRTPTPKAAKGQRPKWPLTDGLIEIEI